MKKSTYYSTETEITKIEEPAAVYHATTHNVAHYLALDSVSASKKISKGLATKELGYLKDVLNCSDKELSEAISMPMRTLTRRRKETKLLPDESDRLFRIGRLVELATIVLKSTEKAQHWLKTPNFALGGVTPLNLAQTTPGLNLVERQLHNMQYGGVV